MNLARIAAAAGLTAALVLVPVARAAEPDVKVDKTRNQKKELLADDGAKPDAPKPAAKPAAKKAPTAKISPEAKAELDQLTAAYQKLTALEVTGTLALDISVGGQVQSQKSEFRGTFAAPNKFRHEMKGDVVVGSTGEKLYVFRPARNDYKTADAPKERVASKKLPNPMREVLQMQNVGLMCALVDDAGAFLLEDVKEVSKAADVSVDDKACAALDFRGDKEDYRVLVDPQTHLVRRVVLDLKRQIEASGRGDVERALLTFDYPTVAPGGKVEDAQFAWAAPQGARDAAGADTDAGGDAAALVGKDAPDFTLNGMDAKPVALKDQQGSVVVLDFWATWCGPCRASLPALNKLYKELEPKGMKAFAVDLEESKEKITPVKAQLIPDVPVLLDEKSEVAKQYGVTGIPQTVVIGKDGKVKKVFVGSGNDAGIRSAVEKALAE
jgi:peroxiredoxin